MTRVEQLLQEPLELPNGIKFEYETMHGDAKVIFIRDSFGMGVDADLVEALLSRYEAQHVTPLVEALRELLEVTLDIKYAMYGNGQGMPKTQTAITKAKAALAPYEGQKT